MNASVTIGSIAITVIAYCSSRVVNRRYPSPFTTPVFLSTAIIIVILISSGITTTDYSLAKEIMTFLLGPATVALAVPLYNNRRILLQNLIPAGIGLVIGSLSTLFVAIAILKYFQVSSVLVASMSVKTVTVPIAIEITKIIGGDPALTAVFVVATGFIGSMLGPWFLDVTGVKHPIARGLSLGTISHGQGTAQAAMEGELQGAIAGVAMGMSAIFTSALIPLVYTYIV
ncbi:LrgB family protein [Brevibacillus sp. SYSU BS000544]|uniref:LrgB family protein n=1 Tax=Brevibacillus sp. SYSU BS000544 TaxID=3416443 RepID=UPI003CE51BD2